MFNEATARATEIATDRAILDAQVQENANKTGELAASKVGSGPHMYYKIHYVYDDIDIIQYKYNTSIIISHHNR